MRFKRGPISAEPRNVGAAAKDKGERDPGSEASNVCHISDSSLTGFERSSVLTEDLNHDPKAEHDDSRKLNRGPDNSKRQQGPHSIPREHYQVSSEYSGNRARCTQRRRNRT